MRFYPLFADIAEATYVLHTLIQGGTMISSQERYTCGTDGYGKPTLAGSGCNLMT